MLFLPFSKKKSHEDLAPCGNLNLRGSVFRDLSVNSYVWINDQELQLLILHYWVSTRLAPYVEASNQGTRKNLINVLPFSPIFPNWFKNST
jgi:hypothetical protein